MAALGVSWRSKLWGNFPICTCSDVISLEQPSQKTLFRGVSILILQLLSNIPITCDYLKMILAAWNHIIHLFASVSHSNLPPDHELLNGRNMSNCSPLHPHVQDSAWHRMGVKYMLIEIEPDEWMKPPQAWPSLEIRSPTDNGKHKSFVEIYLCGWVSLGGNECKLVQQRFSEIFQVLNNKSNI